MGNHWIRVWCVLALVLTATALHAQSGLFADGIASGDVTASGAVLWARTSGPATVELELSLQEDFSTIYARYTMTSSSASDYVLNKEVSGLTADSLYYYRWRSGEEVSATGRFRTAPLPWGPASVRFAFSGDSDGTLDGDVPGHGDYEILDAIRSHDPAFFVFLGDIVYTDSEFRDAPAMTLEEYRAAYKVNRDIPAYRDLVESTSMYPIWDDHEVANDWWPAMIDPERFANGRQAFLEHMPIRPPRMPADEGCIAQPLFRHFRWGQDVEMIILDERSCRSEPAEEACRFEDGSLDLAPAMPALLRGLAGLPPSPPPGCLEAIADPARTLIGPTQKWLLKYYLLYSTAKFKFIINEVGIQQYLALPYDRWEGYAAERAEILNFIRDNNIENVIFLTADAHANVVGDVVLDYVEDREPIAQEYITGPIATNTLAASVEKAMGISESTLNQVVRLLPVRCWDLNVFGYGLVEVDAAAGSVTISLRGEDGEPLPSKGDPSVRCIETIQAQ